MAIFWTSFAKHVKKEYAISAEMAFFCTKTNALNLVLSD